MKKILSIILFLFLVTSLQAVGVLNIQKSAGGVSQIGIGTTVSFALHITASVEDIQNSEIWDTLPVGLTFVSAVPTAIVSGRLYRWSWTEDLLNGSSHNAVIHAVLTSYQGSTLTNTMSAKGTGGVALKTSIITLAVETPTITVTPTDHGLATHTDTPTETVTDTITETETISETETNTFTPTITNTVTKTITNTITPTFTVTPTPIPNYSSPLIQPFFFLWK